MRIVLLVTVFLGMVACEQRESEKQIQASPISAAPPWPFSGAAELRYSVSTQAEDRPTRPLATIRTVRVERDPQASDTVRVSHLEQGQAIRTDTMRYREGIVEWLGFESRDAPDGAVVFRRPIPIFSPDFKGGERWGNPESLTMSVVGWMDVPLSSGTVKACKIRLDFNHGDHGFQRQIWYHRELGIVFEHGNYYRGGKITRQEQSTILSH